MADSNNLDLAEKKVKAVYAWVEREFSGIPTEWVKTIMEKEGEFSPLPMWGTMWILDDRLAETLMKHSRLMCGDYSELRDNLDSIEDEAKRAEVKAALDAVDTESLSWGESALLEEYVDEEMAGARNIIGTAGFIYQVDGRYLLGVNGAGWNFYDGIWDRLYDICGMQWHLN